MFVRIARVLPFSPRQMFGIKTCYKTALRLMTSSSFDDSFVEEKLSRFANKVVGQAVTIDFTADDSDQALSSALQLQQENQQLLHVNCSQSSFVDVQTDQEKEDCTAVWDTSDPLLEAYILPKGMRWPTLSANDVKQRGCAGSRVLFSRTALHCKGRVADTLRWIKKSELNSVAWIGAPGIGKTAAMSGLLMHFLKKLGEPDAKKYVFLRVGGSLVRFTKNADSGNIEARSIPCGTLQHLADISSKLDDEIPAEDCVLLLELEESENDPLVLQPLVVSTSCREAEDVVLKSTSKGGCVNFYLCDPPSFPEVSVMRDILAIEAAAEGDAAVTAAAMKKIPSAEQLRLRVDEVGCLPRILFQSEINYKKYKALVTAATSNFFTATKDLTVFNLPRDCKFFVTPRVRRGISIPLVGMTCELLEGGMHLEKELGSLPMSEFRYLSASLRAKINAQVKLPHDLEAIETLGDT